MILAGMINPMFRPIYTAPVALLSLLTACAVVPKMAPVAEIRGPGTFAAERSLAATAGEFPSDQWWRGFGDPALAQLIAEGLANSPDVTAAKARVDAANALLQQADAAASPKFGIDANAGGQRQSQNQGFPAGLIPGELRSQGRIAGNFSLDLDLWGRNRSALREATSQAEAARVDAAQARLLLTTTIASTYADLNRQFAQRDAAVVAAQIAHDTKGLTHQRFVEGLENVSAVDRARARLAQLESEVTAIEESMGLTRHALAALLGAGPDRGLAIGSPSLRSDLQLTLPANLPLDLIGRRPDIVSARLRTEAAAARIGLARADFYPSVNLSAIAGLQAIGIGSLLQGSSFFTTFGPALRLPIFDGGATAGRYRKSRADFDLAVATYNSTLSTAFREVANAVTSKRSLQAKLVEARRALTALRDARRVADLRFRNGLGDKLQLLGADEAAASAQRQVATLEAQTVAADIALIQALGGGFTETSIVQPGS